MEYATTPAWLRESLSAARRAASADLQATSGLGFKRPPLASLNACTRKVGSRVISADLRIGKKSYARLGQKSAASHQLDTDISQRAPNFSWGYHFNRHLPNASAW